MADEAKDAPQAGYVKAEDVDARIEAAIKKERSKHDKEVATLRASMPVAMVTAHGGGPGYDDHQPSWSLAAQEHSQRGEWEGWGDESDDESA